MPNMLPHPHRFIIKTSVTNYCIDCLKREDGASDDLKASNRVQEALKATFGDCSQLSKASKPKKESNNSLFKEI